MGPAQAGQVVDQGLGQEALVPVGQDGKGAVALGELGPVLAQHQGHVGEPGQLGPQGLVNEELPGGVGDVVLAPDDLGDPHGDVIHHHREVVGGDAVGPLQHQVVQFLVVEGDGALDAVVPVGDPGQGGLEAHHGVRTLARPRSRQRPSYLGLSPRARAAWRRASSSSGGQLQ